MLLIQATPLYEFLRLCNEIALEKKVLDCGAGGLLPPLTLFFEHGYEAHGVDISEKHVNYALSFAKEKNLELKIIAGDMRSLPYADETFSFVYTYETIFHMRKKEMKKALNEMIRVLRPGGLLYLNFLSLDGTTVFDQSSEIERGEFVSKNDGEIIWDTLHSCYSDEESRKLIEKYQLIFAQKRILERPLQWKEGKVAYMDYIIKK